MEIFLNLIWVLLAVASLPLWVSYGRQEGASRRAQLAALVILIAILFPVISVTDDLLTIQNPAEIECCARRSHSVSCPHSIFSAVAALPPQAFASPWSGFEQFVGPPNSSFSTVENPALAPIQNRPPPAA
ncbi:MAG: hypothetical protein ABR905_03940 [Terracidiphilus sp.]|jgi:hypothetical protein